jgi:hypothetical protein
MSKGGDCWRNNKFGQYTSTIICAGLWLKAIWPAVYICIYTDSVRYILYTLIEGSFTFLPSFLPSSFLSGHYFNEDAETNEQHLFLLLFIRPLLFSLSVLYSTTSTVFQTYTRKPSLFNHGGPPCNYNIVRRQNFYLPSSFSPYI